MGFDFKHVGIHSFADAERVLSKQGLLLDNAHLTVKPISPRKGKFFFYVYVCFSACVRGSVSAYLCVLCVLCVASIKCVACVDCVSFMCICIRTCLSVMQDTA